MGMGPMAMCLLQPRENSMSLPLPALKIPSNLIIMCSWMFVILNQPSQPYMNCIQSFSPFSVFIVSLCLCLDKRLVQAQSEVSCFLVFFMYLLWSVLMFRWILSFKGMASMSYGYFFFMFPLIFSTKKKWELSPTKEDILYYKLHKRLHGSFLYNYTFSFWSKPKWC